MRKLLSIFIIAALLVALLLVFLPPLVTQTPEKSPKQERPLSSEKIDSPISATTSTQISEPQIIEFHEYIPSKIVDSSAQQTPAPVRLSKPKRTNKKKLLTLGKKYISTGDIESAITIFSKALKKFPDDIDALNHLGIAYSMNKQFTQAQEIFLQVIEQDPKATGAHMNVARIFGQQGNAEKERYHLAQVVKQEPDSKRGKQALSRLWLLKGKDFFQKKEYEKGEAEIKKLLKKRPNSPAALFALGSAYLEQNRGKEAVKIFTQLAVINPDNFKAQFGLARAYLSAGKFDEAFVQFDKAAATTQSDIQKKQLKAMMLNAYMNDGTRLSKQGKLKLGQEQFEKAIELDPDNPRAHFGLGGTYLHMKQLDKARESYKRVTKLDPTNPVGYKQLGNVLLGLGEFNEAAEAYLTAVTLESDSKKAEKLLFKAQVVLARAELKSENYDAAEKLFQTLIDLNPDEYEPYLYMGFVKNRKGDLDEAVKMYEKLLEIKPGYVPGLWFLSLLYEQQGEDENALMGYRKIVNGSTGKLAEKSKERIRIVERRLRPDSYAMTYQMGYDDNVNQSPDQPDSDYRTDLFFNLAYQFRPKKNLKYNLSLSPSYSVFHLQQFDFFSYDASASINSGPVDRNWTLGYSYRKNSRLMLDQSISQSSVYKVSGYRRLNMKSISPETWGSDVSSTVTGTLSYTDKESLVGTVSDANIYTAGATFRQPFAMRSNLRLGYTLTRTDNKNEVDADFANTSHELSANLNKSFRHKLSGSLSYQLLYSRFKNPDSFTDFKKRRSNLQSKLSARLNYRLNSQLFFYGQYSWQIVRSEFSSNIVLSGETIATLEQNSLVSYLRNNFVLGFRLEF